jgi:hypothetical protein
MGRSKDLTGAKVMVDMHDLEELLDACHRAATSDCPDLRNMLHHRAYRDPSNPLRKLLNQYNASVELLATPPEGEA